MADLKTTYKDDVLNTSANEKRKYNMITNEDGTVSLVDATDYSQVGDSFGAADINATNEKVNELNTNLGDNILTYNESEDAYYIQHGADSVPKKLGDSNVPWCFPYTGDEIQVKIKKIFTQFEPYTGSTVTMEHDENEDFFVFASCYSTATVSVSSSEYKNTSSGSKKLLSELGNQFCYLYRVDANTMAIYTNYSIVIVYNTI